MSSIRVGIRSDICLLTAALARLLEAEPAFLRVDESSHERAQVLLVDSRIADAINLCARHASKEIALLAIAVTHDGTMAEDLLIAGARGILFHDAPESDLLQAIPHVHRGQIWAPRHVVGAAWQKCRSDVLAGERMAGWARLSAREREVLRYAASGCANKELGDRLGISEATVKVHLTHIFQKVGCHTRGELAAAYHGVVPMQIERTARRIGG